MQLHLDLVADLGGNGDSDFDPASRFVQVEQDAKNIRSIGENPDYRGSRPEQPPLNATLRGPGSRVRRAAF